MKRIFDDAKTKLESGTLEAMANAVLEASPAAKVHEFTEAAATEPLPTTPIPLDRDRTFYLMRMLLSEVYELARTVCPGGEAEAFSMVESALQQIDRGGEPYSEDPLERAAQQADAIVDMGYYGMNVLGGNGINCDPVFHLVHEANMAKRDPATKKFKRRESDGKIIKPDGWKPADIRAEMQRQQTDGSWSNWVTLEKQ
jgi:predicted HAD superfamily Cof-like phosphohydrolase